MSDKKPSKLVKALTEPYPVRDEQGRLDPKKIARSIQSMVGDVEIDVDAIEREIDRAESLRREVRNPLRNPAISDALERDLGAPRHWSKQEFAEYLGLKNSSVSWWFSNNAIPLTHIPRTIEILGTSSRTYQVLLATAKSYIELSALRGGPPPSAKVQNLLAHLVGLRFFEDYVEEHMKPGVTLDDIKRGFSDKYPQYVNVMHDRVGPNTLGGIHSLPLVNEDTVVMARKSMGVGSHDNRRLIINLGSKDLADRAKRQLDPFGIKQNKTLVRGGDLKRRYIELDTDDIVIAQILVPSVDVDGHPRIFGDSVKAAAFELHQVMTDDKSNGKVRDYILHLFDPNDVTYSTGNELMGYLASDIKAMGIKLVHSDSLEDIGSDIHHALYPNKLVDEQEEYHQNLEDPL